MTELSLFRLWKLLIFIFLLVQAGCRPAEPDVESGAEKTAAGAEHIEVETAPAQRQSLRVQTLSNGILKPATRTSLSFQKSGKVKMLAVKNGDYVKQGDTLAALDNRRAWLEMESAEIQVEQARTELLDLLLTQQGRSLADTARLPVEKKENLFIKSGMKSARNALKQARLNYAQGFVIAPHPGRVSNVNVQNFSAVSAGDECCLLLDTRKWNVAFFLMENEADGIVKGMEVEVMPFNQEKRKTEAVLTEINPVVDENGLVHMKATLKQKAPWMIDGRNVSVKLIKAIPDRLVVPEKAIVLRSNREVVFKYQDGLAKWVYVEVLERNDTHAAVSGKLNSGDKVIVTNNMNLSHDAEVSLTKKK